MVDIEKRRCEELEGNLAALKKSFLEQQEADKEKMEARSEEHTSELQSRPHISYAVFCLKKKKKKIT